MINFIILILYFIYNFVLFLINNKIILFSFIILNIMASIIFKIKIKKHFKFLIKNLLFIIFIFICNLLFTDLISSLIVCLKLFIAIDYSYLIFSYLETDKLREAFYYLFYPLKIFKVDINSLTLIIAITFAFIPILIDNATNIKKALKSKGLEFNFKNLLTRPHVFLITYLNSLFEQIEELEKTLIVKGY